MLRSGKLKTCHHRAVREFKRGVPLMAVAQKVPAPSKERRGSPRRQATQGTVCRLAAAPGDKPWLALVWNIWFYFNVGTGWLQLVSILWLYVTLFWISLHIYVVPLLLHIAEPRIFDVYRRAAFVALGHAGYTIVLLIAILVIGALSVVFLPVYVLVAGAYISLIQAHALREIRRRHGDLVAEADEEVSRL